MPSDRGPLGKIADQVRAESVLPIYPFKGLLPTDEEIYWEGTEVAEFIMFAKKVGAPIIYLNEHVVPEGEEDPAYAPHVGETSSVHAAFLLDGTYHSFLEVAEWVPEEAEDEEQAPGDEEVPSDEREGHHLFPGETSSESVRHDLSQVDAALGSKRQEVMDGYLEKVRTRDEPPPDPDSEWDVRRDLLVYLADLLKLPGLKSGTTYFELHSDMDLSGTLNPLIAEIARKLRAADREVVERAVSGCEEWVSRREIPLRSLNLERVREYAQENSLRLSRAGLRELRDRVSAAIKRRRTGGSHHV